MSKVTVEPAHVWVAKDYKGESQVEIFMQTKQGDIYHGFIDEDDYLLLGGPIAVEETSEALLRNIIFEKWTVD